MAFDAPKTHHYFLMSLEDMDKPVDQMNDEEDLVFVGGEGVLDELAKHMTEDMIVGYMGITGMRCILMTTLTRKECEERVEMAKVAFDRKLKGNT